MSERADRGMEGVPGRRGRGEGERGCNEAVVAEACNLRHE